VRHVPYDADAITSAVRSQLAHGRYPSSPIYYRPDTSDQILNVLATADLYTQKRFFDAAMNPAAPVKV
jgi:hypothetical protein